MSGATARIFTLLSTTTTATTTALPPLLFLRRRISAVFLSKLHTHSYSPRVVSITAAAAPLPWPEWSHFVGRVSDDSAVFRRRSGFHLDEFAESTQLTGAFLNDVAAFLSFSRFHPSLLWSLPREDIEVVIENVTPTLFNDAAVTTSRLRSFLAGDSLHIPESDGPSTVDLMKFLLSYVYMAFVSSEEVRISDKVESSVRKLFGELAKSSGTSSESITSSAQTRFPESYGVGPSSSGSNIEMKRGDWICTRCTFMNFAKNKNCLQCEELRPKKFVTGGEWECPQCNFFNFSRNIVCLRCDCKKPEANPLQNPTNASSVNSINIGKPLDGSEDDKPQPWLTKITQLEKTPDFSSSIPEEDFSKFMQSDGIDAVNQSDETNSNTNVSIAQKSSVSHNEKLLESMPLETGENRFVVSKKKDRSLTSPTYKRRVAMEQAGSSSNHVPFVPFPPGYFAQEKSDSTHASSKSEESRDAGTVMQNTSNIVAVSSQPSGRRNSDLGKTGERSEHKPTNSYEVGEKSRIDDVSLREKSLEGSLVKEADPLDMSEEAKAQRWFRRVAQIKDISELSQIPDEDFPSIMPLRKGVNRFVVSKRKSPLERRLASSQYTRNLPVANSEPDRDTKGTESS